MIKKSFCVLSGYYLVAGVCVKQQRSNTDAEEIFLSELKMSACNKQQNMETDLFRLLQAASC